MVKSSVLSWTGPIMSEPARKILSSFGWSLKKRRLVSVAWFSIFCQKVRSQVFSRPISFQKKKCAREPLSLMRTRPSSCLLVLRWKVKVRLQSVDSTNVWPVSNSGNLYLVVEFSTIASVRKSTISFILVTSNHLCQFTSQVSVLPKVSKVSEWWRGWERHSCSFQTLVSKGEPSIWELKNLKIASKTPSNIIWTT